MDFLSKLTRLRDFPRSRVFFYLDAHVQDSIRYHKPPVIEELQIIFGNWTEAVVMIDDFQGPGTHYGFIQEGHDTALDLQFCGPLNYLGLSAFFPTADTSQETGAKRGWVFAMRRR